MNFKAPLFALALVPSLACSRPDRTPRPKAPASAAASLDSDERSDGWPKPEFDEEGTYDMKEGVPEYEPAVPYTAITVPAPTGMDHALMVDPSLADACELPKARVYFETDSARLHDTDDRALRTLSKCLQESPLEGASLALFGHADPRGTDAYNRELGLERANAVAQALRELGVENARLRTYSRGEFEASDEPQEWPDDRRVRIRLER